MKIQFLGLIISAASVPTLAFASPPEGEADGAFAVEASVDTEAEAGAEAGAEADADADADADSTAEPRAKDRGDQKWIKRWAPEPGMGEIGIFGGAYFPSTNHELFGASRDLPEQGYKPLAFVAPELGVRGGYYPLRFFGIEAEGAVMPTRLREGGEAATLYSVRGHLVAQLGLWSVTPFVLLGGGGIGVASERAALGSDIDPMLHVGGGVKIYINRWVMLRVDVRDVVTHKRGVDEVFNGHNLELLLGLSGTLGRKRTEAKPAPRRPTPVGDRDGDGIADDIDQCPNEAETFNGYKDEDGCPELDSDGDGIWDDIDECPDQAETFNDYRDEDGCPEFDSDGDGIWDDIDQCPDQPETFNGYKDEDGCPDEVPDEVKAFTGAIKGITFENNSDQIRPSSAKTLDNAVEVLNNNPDIRLKIIGHTDDRGDHDHNVDLSRRRALAVKTYLTEHGVSEGRITTDGFGPDKPVDSNASKAGRANNRRTEFEIIQGN